LPRAVDIDLLFSVSQCVRSLLSECSFWCGSQPGRNWHICHSKLFCTSAQLDM